MTSLLDLLRANIERMGEEAAWKLDNIIRGVISNVSTGLTRTYPAGIADYAALAASTPSAGSLKGEAGLFNVTALDLSRAPMFGGEYIGVTSPEGLWDMMQTGRWVEANQYAGATNIFRREAGMLDGVRYVKTTNAQKENLAAGGVEGTYAVATARSDQAYATLYLGAQSYAVPKLAGTTSPKAPKLIILRDPDKYDPAGQYTMVTWTAFFNAMVNNRTYGRLHLHKSTYGVAA